MLQLPLIFTENKELNPPKSIAQITPAHLYKYAEAKSGDIEYMTNIYAVHIFRGEELDPNSYSSAIKLSSGKILTPNSTIGIKTSDNAYYWFEVSNDAGEFNNSLSFSHRYSQNTGKTIKAWRTGNAYLNKVYNYFNNL